MSYNYETRFYYVAMFGWLLSLFIYTLLSILGLHEINNIIFILSSILYLFIFFKPYEYIKISHLVIVYLIIRIAYFIFITLDDDFFNNITFIGDANGYHIPLILSLNSQNFLEYLFNYQEYSVITGKVTHIFYAFFFNIADILFNFGKSNYFKSVTLVVYILNTFLLLGCSLYLYYNLLKINIAKRYAVYAVSLILFAPFLITWSSYVTKETLHIALVVFIAVAILRKQYLVLFIIALIFFIDRMYMLYLFIFIVLLSNSINKSIVISIIFLLLALGIIFLPLENYYAQYQYIMDAYVDKAETGDSLVSKSNIFTDVLKIIFSPLFVSAFKERYLEFNIFFRQHLVAGLLMTYFLYKIIVISKANNFKYFIILILLFHLILFPDGARQKITVLIPFLAIFYSIYLHSKYFNIDYNRYWKI